MKMKIKKCSNTEAMKDKSAMSDTDYYQKYSAHATG